MAQVCKPRPHVFQGMRPWEYIYEISVVITPVFLTRSGPNRSWGSLFGSRSESSERLISVKPFGRLVVAGWFCSGKGLVVLKSPQNPRNFAGMPSRLLLPSIWNTIFTSIPARCAAPTKARPRQSFSKEAGGFP